MLLFLGDDGTWVLLTGSKSLLLLYNVIIAQQHKTMLHNV